ncbi:ATP-binding protein [Plastoroseomonas hellenica]|uniref:ATP-binding protein n=1 Tax=Plastoroseomonas hellenica TaxID=2687306 RepID=UPI001BA8F877|nr:ATP-binding protein [Plastoroseomonas hellenica]MBR0643614.1 response regulator [Plastoroseomonas hellenica]
MSHTRSLRVAIILAATALILAQAVVTGLLVNRAHDAQVAAARETVERVAHGVEASINRSFVQVDAMLAALPAVLAPYTRQSGFDPAVINRMLQEMNHQSFTYRDVLLLRLDGTPVVAALPVSRRRRLPLSLQSDFAEVATRGGSVSIGGPVKNPNTGEWSLFFARNVTIAGTGPMIAVAEVPVPLVQTLLSVGGVRSGLRVTLERSDGKLMASLPHDELRIGTQMQPEAARFAPPDRAIGIQPSRFDGREAFALALPTLYPALAIVTTLDVEAALGGWYQDRQRAYIASGAIALLMAAIAAALMIVLRVRERAEDERAEARQTLENALESMSDGFVMFDPDDRLIACNSRYKDFYRISAPFIVPGALFDDIMREGARRGQYPQAGPDIESFVRISKEFHHGDQAPMERLLPDGRWVLITERRTPDGGTVGIRTDITPLKRAMVELAAARDAAAAAGEAKTDFLARMSHELRTPLNGILGFAQVLLDDPRLEQDQRDQIRILHSAGRHLLELVNGLLDLSKIEAGRMELDPRPVALRDLLEGCVALLRTEVARKSIAFRMDLDPSLPAAVQADPTRLRQMLLNLLANAVKFTPSGGRVTLAASRLPDGRLRFEVHDTGPGIAEDQRHLLFRDFVQLATLGATGAHGTGLGLAISARLAAMMGGHIGCDSIEGDGSIFWVELPLAPAELPKGERRTDTATRPERSLRILVVDDIAANRDVARALLRADGHVTEVADDGTAAVERVARGGVDVVLMDLQMPDMDGMEATRRIRALPPPHNRIPVLAVTASALPEQVEACRAAGMDGHLPKPIDRRALAAALARLNLAPAEQASAPETPPLLDGETLPALTNELGPATADIMAEFGKELATLCEALSDPALDGAAETPRLRQLAHRAFGAARNLGAPLLARDALALERAAQAGHPAPELRTAVVGILAATQEAVSVRRALDAARP